MKRVLLNSALIGCIAGYGTYLLDAPVLIVLAVSFFSTSAATRWLP